MLLAAQPGLARRREQIAFGFGGVAVIFPPFCKPWALAKSLSARHPVSLPFVLPPPPLLASFHPESRFFVGFDASSGEIDVSPPCSCLFAS